MRVVTMMRWRCEPLPALDACCAVHLMSGRQKAVTVSGGLGMVTASCFAHTLSVPRRTGRWCSEPVNDPLTTRGNLAAALSFVVMLLLLVVVGRDDAMCVTVDAAKHDAARWHKLHIYFGRMHPASFRHAFDWTDQPCLPEPGKSKLLGLHCSTPPDHPLHEKRGSVPGFVHIVDDDAQFATAMERRLKHAGYEVAVYASAQQLLDHFPSDSIPGCILLDVQIPGLDGLALQRRLNELGSALPIIFLSGYPDIRVTVRTIKAGAEDFFTKPVSSDDLLPAIERALARHQASREQRTKLDIIQARIGALTPRERQVFHLIVAGGKTNKQIGILLVATERTIKAHRHRVMEKMQVRTLAELVSLAERAGVLTPGETGRPSSIA
jgi:FixJ family two-component response regulator